MPHFQRVLGKRSGGTRRAAGKDEPKGEQEDEM